MWSKHHSRCVFYINNMMHMQQECVYCKRCSPHPRLVFTISIVGTTNRAMCIELHYIQTPCIGLYLLNTYAFISRLNTKKLLEK